MTMALSKTITTKHGFVASSAYLRVENARISSKITLDFSLSYYKESNQDEPFETRSFVCAYDMAGENPLEQAYEHLKTLPEFAGATDC